jgi:D-alanine-D-alanine ligase
MRVGITCTLKDEESASVSPTDDAQEEFDSHETLAELAMTIASRGHRVEVLEDKRTLLYRLFTDPPEFVFNLAEGRGTSRNREAWVPGILEMLGIPYTGSDPLTMAVTLDKPVAKTLVAAVGVAVARGLTIRTAADAAELTQPAWRAHKVILKPAWEGSSKGIRRNSLIEAGPQAAELAAELLQKYQQPVLAEEFIPGEEVTVGVVGNSPPHVLGILHVVPRQPSADFVYSLEVKRNYESLVDYHSPPKLPDDVCARIQEAALQVFAAVGCRDVARIDFRVRDGVPYFLEVNPLPGINPISSDLVILARLRGWEYERLIGAIFEAALARYGLSDAF